jgi:hypothetical protein
METPGNLRKDGYQLLEQAQEIVAQAVSEKRSLTIAETALIASLRGEGQPMLLRAQEIQARLARTGVE